MDISLTGYIHLIFFGIVIPISAIRSMKLLESRSLPPRRRYFVAVLAQVGLFGLMSVLVAMQNRINVLGGRVPSLTAIGAGVAFLAIAIPFGWTRWTKAVKEKKRIAALFMPTDNVERVMWIASAAGAGIAEEITWRGVQTTLLIRLTDSIPIAIALSIVMFSVAHAIQGWKSVGVIMVFAAGFHVLVWLAGSLYVAIAVHFLYDLTAGLAYSYLGRKFGYSVEGASGTSPMPATDSV